jgi:hypothetical protein
MTTEQNTTGQTTTLSGPATGRPGDFDFFTGSWDGRHRRLRRPLALDADWDEFPSTTECWPLFGGAANIDELRVPERGFTGVSLRLLDAATGLWSIYWASSRTGLLALPPVTGWFDGGVGRFYSPDVHEGRPIHVRYTWSRITPASARWEQAFSPDEGATWETNWITEFTRRS